MGKSYGELKAENKELRLKNDELNQRILVAKERFKQLEEYNDLLKRQAKMCGDLETDCKRISFMLTEKRDETAWLKGVIDGLVKCKDKEV